MVKNKRIFKSLGSLIAVFAMLFGMIFNGIPMPKVSADATITATPPTGTGSQTNPYIIATPGNLLWMAQNNAAGTNNGFYNKYFIQTNDIDVSGISSWTPIGDASIAFSGNYNGYGHAVKGLTYTGSGNVAGLFGYTLYATISCLAVTNVNINLTNPTGPGPSSGALIGTSSEDKISNCYTTGTISLSTSTNSSPFVGGFIGDISCTTASTAASAIPAVTNCYSLCNVTSSGTGICTGGFIGHCGTQGNSVLATNCFSTGTVIGQGKWLGQLIGASYPDINYCYYTGTQNVVGQFAGGKANNCSQKDESFFKAQSNYSDANYSSDYKWDFTNTWKIDSTMNNGYPVLIPKTVPTPVSDLAITGGGNGNVKFSFTAPTGATDVQLQISSDGGGNYKSVTPTEGTLNAASTSATVSETSLKAGTQYFFKLVVTGGNNAGDSNIVKFGIYPMTPNAVTQGTTSIPSCGTTSNAKSKEFNIIKPAGLDSIKLKLDDEVITEGYTIDRLSSSAKKSGVWNLEIPADIQPGKYTVEWFQLNQLQVTYDTSINFTVTGATPASAKAPTIGNQPADATADLGQTATFSIGTSTTDSGVLSYQWQRSNDSGKTWQPISGASAQTATYTTAATTLTDDGAQIRCVVTNTLQGTTATATSNPVTLHVNAPASAKAPSIGTQPTDETADLGKTATFIITASTTDGGTVSYQWQRLDNASNQWQSITADSVNNATYTTPALTLADNNAQIRCVVTNTLNGTTATATSNPVTLHVNAPASAKAPSITAQPTDEAADLGKTATFSIAASTTDGGTVSYQWQKSNDSGKTWESITADSVNNATYTTPALTPADDNAQIRCIVTNTLNGTVSTATSNSVTLHINAPTNAKVPIITNQPVSISVPLNTLIEMPLEASTTSGTLSYQWYKNSINSYVGAYPVPDNQNTFGINSPGFTPDTSVVGDAYYYCTITNTDNSVTGQKTATINSDIVCVDVYELRAAKAPVITGQPVGGTVKFGALTTVSVQATGDHLTYQWYINSVPDINTAKQLPDMTGDSCQVPTSVSQDVYLACNITNTDNTAPGQKSASTLTNWVKVTILPLEAPSTVMVDGGDKTVRLKWQGVDGAVSYIVYESTNPDTLGYTQVATVADTVYQIDGLTNGITYYFAISAASNTSIGAKSSPVKVVCHKQAPFSPELSVTSSGNGYVGLTWNKVDGAVKYAIYQGDSKGINTKKPVAIVDATVVGSVCYVQGLAYGTTYSFAISAINDEQTEGNVSATVYATTTVPVVTPVVNPPAPTPPYQSPDNGITVLVNGNEASAGTATTTQIGDVTTTTVVLDPNKVSDQLAAVASGAVIVVPINTKSDVVKGELTGQTVQNMESKAATLEVRTGAATYVLPAKEVDIQTVAKELGASDKLSDVKVSIGIADSTKQAQQSVQAVAARDAFTVVAPPVDFTVTCTYGGKVVPVDKFNSYVERDIAIPAGVDPSKITTGIVLDGDGSVRHVPTKVIVIGNKYYAKINSLTNSTYSVVYNAVSFNDVTNSWAKDSINDMGSRMVINGVGNNNFEPTKNMTRAEFATILVKALGLKPGTGRNNFKDIKGGKWYYAYVKTASSYGLITGITKDTFAPDKEITRQEAMVMIARAMKLTGLKVNVKSDLSSFKDADKVSAWAKDGAIANVSTGLINGRDNKIAPADKITRAEVAVIVQRLLQKSGLI